MSLTLYTHPLSGHAHRVQLFLSILGVEAELVEVDLQARAQRRPEYLRLNPFGQVPVLVDGDVVIADSNAILTYLALSHGREDWLPREPARAAEVQRWLSVAAGELAQGPGAARRMTIFRQTQGLDEAITRAHALLAIVEGVLSERAFLAGDRPTIADLANYTYVAHAPEGGVSLDAYPAVRAWLGRIEALPGFVPMRVTPVGLRASA